MFDKDAVFHDCIDDKIRPYPVGVCSLCMGRGVDFKAFTRIIELQTKNTETCKWHKNGFHMEEHDYWETGCGNMFQFNNDGPKENHFEFCPYCGKSIEEVGE